MTKLTVTQSSLDAEQGAARARPHPSIAARIARCLFLDLVRGGLNQRTGSRCVHGSAIQWGDVRHAVRAC